MVLAFCILTRLHCWEADLAAKEKYDMARPSKHDPASMKSDFELRSTARQSQAINSRVIRGTTKSVDKPLV